MAKIDPLTGCTEIDYIEMEGLQVSPFKLLTTNNNELIALGYANNGCMIANHDTPNVELLILFP